MIAQKAAGFNRRLSTGAASARAWFLSLILLHPHLLHFRPGRGSGGTARLELLDAASGVDELLLARVERVAFCANFNVELRFGRAYRERVTARTDDVRLREINGMDVFFHSFSIVAHF
jgi:hypothetical protein